MVRSEDWKPAAAICNSRHSGPSGRDLFPRGSDTLLDYYDRTMEILKIGETWNAGSPTDTSYPTTEFAVNDVVMTHPCPETLTHSTAMHGAANTRATIASLRVLCSDSAFLYFPIHSKPSLPSTETPTPSVAGAKSQGRLLAASDTSMSRGGRAPSGQPHRTRRPLTCRQHT